MSVRGYLFVMMKNLSLSLSVVLVGLAGCGPTHRHSPLLEVGSPLYLSVEVPEEMAVDATGEIHYRLPASRADYRSKTLQKRGRELFTSLPTSSLREGQQVAYYFDVTSGGKLTALRSPQDPYITEIVDRDEMISRSLRFTVSHSNTDRPVVFRLYAGDFEVTEAKVYYSPPDISGYIVQDMERHGRNWVLSVEGDRVTPGSWGYTMSAVVEGTAYSHPPSGEKAYFKVKQGKGSGD